MLASKTMGKGVHYFASRRMDIASKIIAIVLPDVLPPELGPAVAEPERSFLAVCCQSRMDSYGAR